MPRLSSGSQKQRARAMKQELHEIQSAAPSAGLIEEQPQPEGVKTWKLSVNVAGVRTVGESASAAKGPPKTEGHGIFDVPDAPWLR